MATNDWVIDLENKIFTIVKTKASTTLKPKYPDIRFTTSGKSVTTPKFPTVYMHELPGVESGSDIDGSGINAVIYSMQIDITTNTSQEDLKRVSAEIIKQFKELRFSISAFPDMSATADIYRSVIRVSRLIGVDDVL